MHNIVLIYLIYSRNEPHDFQRQYIICCENPNKAEKNTIIHTHVQPPHVQTTIEEEEEKKIGAMACAFALICSFVCSYCGHHTHTHVIE